MILARSFIFLLAIVYGLSSCTVGPNYVRPPTIVPVKYKEAKGKKIITANPFIKWKVATPKDLCRPQQWWLIFQDAKLNELENLLNGNNQTIINTYYNFMQARSLVDEAAAAYYPTLTGALTFTRQKSGSSSSFISTSGGSTSTGVAATAGNGSSTLSSSHVWLLAASWEPDIWGLVRRTVEASRAGAQASDALYAATRLSSQALLAQTYFELRGMDALIAMLRDTVKNDRKALQITKNLYTAGVAGRADVVQAQSVLEAAEAQEINTHILRGQYEHAIAVLIGLPPDAFSLSPVVYSFIPPDIPISVPTELLERRPDIAQAERLMVQANAQIGVAIAAYFPSLTLNGTGSTGAPTFGQLFSVPTFSWSLGAQFSETILDGGLRNATVCAAKSGYLASVANYRQVVLAAFQDVEDNLVSLRVLNQQAVVEKKAVASAKLALRLVFNQYKAGTVSYTSVITAQINLLTAQQNAINVDYERMVSAVGVVRALGGGLVNPFRC